MKIKEFTAWFDEYNIKGIRFTFDNGENIKISDTFGVTSDKSGLKQSVNVTVNEPVKSVQILMVNTQLSSDADAKSGWYIVNIGFNGKEEMKAGPSDSKYPSSYARRDLLDQRILSS